MNVSRLMRGVSAAVLALGLVAGSVYEASAEGFAISTLSARGGAFGGGAASGMVARADDASAVAYNPAGLTQLEGTQIMGGLAAVALNLDLETDQHWCSNSHQVWPIPHFYLSHRINEKFAFGVGMFTRWGLGHSYPDGWASSDIANTSAFHKNGIAAGSALKSITLLTSTINPTLAYKINDVWSVAAGVSYTWGYLSLNNQLYVGQAYSATAHVGDVRIHSENGRSFGYNLAVHAKFNEQWSAGLTYRSHERMKFNGSARVRGNSNDIKNFNSLPMSASTYLAANGGLYNSRGKATIVLPDVITLGVAYKPTERLSFEADVAYTVWSRWRNLQVDLFGGNPTASLAQYSMGSTEQGISQQKNWRDTWALSFSTEYWALDWLALRAGILYETSPLNGSYYNDYFVPTNGRLQYAAGIGLKYEDWTLDFSYCYMQEREVDLKAGSTGGTVNGKFGNGYDHTFCLTLGYKF